MTEVCWLFDQAAASDSRLGSLTTPASAAATRRESAWCRFPLRFDPGFPSRTDPALMMVSGSGVRQVPRFLLCGFGGFRRAVLETEAVVSSFENVAAVGETVE